MYYLIGIITAKAPSLATVQVFMAKNMNRYEYGTAAVNKVLLRLSGMLVTFENRLMYSRRRRDCFVSLTVGSVDYQHKK